MIPMKPTLLGRFSNPPASPRSFRTSTTLASTGWFRMPSAAWPCMCPKNTLKTLSRCWDSPLRNHSSRSSRKAKFAPAVAHPLVGPGGPMLDSGRLLSSWAFRSRSAGTGGAARRADTPGAPFLTTGGCFAHCSTPQLSPCSPCDGCCFSRFACFCRVFNSSLLSIATTRLIRACLDGPVPVPGGRPAPERRPPQLPDFFFVTFFLLVFFFALIFCTRRFQGDWATETEPLGFLLPCQLLNCVCRLHLLLVI